MESKLENNPWKGLASYTEGEILYGRNEDIENLLNLIVTNKEITILFGPSGVGKTSLLRAGLFQWFYSSHIFPVYIRLGHDEKDKSYVQQVIEAVENEAKKHNIEQIDLTQTNSQCASLWEFLHRYDFQNEVTSNGETGNKKKKDINTEKKINKWKPLIFFDQFEELFTISSERTEQVKEFINDLGNILNGTLPEYLLSAYKKNLPSQKQDNKSTKQEDITNTLPLINLKSLSKKLPSFKTERDFLLAISIREDYIYNLDRIAPSIPALKRNRYFLHGLNKEGAREVIESPK